MMPNRRRSLLTLGVLAASAGCGRLSLANTPTATTAGEALAGQRALGQSLLRFWGLEVYRVTLYGGNGFDAQRFEKQRLGLELEYLRNFSGKDIAKRSLGEMQGIAPLEATQAKDWLDAMSRSFPDVRAGDRLLGVHEPESGTRFYLNGRLYASIDDPAFSARFFGIWLSPKTSQPKLREALIGGAAR